jgi:rhodanese-related sulfurtransferase/arsenate reductase-like glutaredoxin family protein
MNMKKGIAVLILLITLSKIHGQHAQVIQSGSEQFKELTAQNNGILLDVRTKSEFKNGHLAEAGNLNYYALDFRKKLILLPRNQPIYLYCNTGYRSEKAAEILIENGYTNVFNLQHGIMEWELLNLPVVVEPDARPDTDNKMTPEQYHAILSSGTPVFFDFYAPWCGSCRKMMPMIDSLMVEYHPRIQMHKINVDASKKLVKELKLLGVPYLVLLNKGEVRFSKNGSASRNELTSEFDQTLLNLSGSMGVVDK